MRKLNLAGQRYGRLLVLEQGELNRFPNGATHTTWRCQCDCGSETTVEAQKLRSGRTTSCGCFRKEIRGAARITHGHSRGSVRDRQLSPEYNSWQAIKDRCFNPRSRAYRNYGGRGITMCDAWRDDFAVFYRDMGSRPLGTTIERIENDGHYEPGNCRWATDAEQARNQRRTIRVSLEDGSEVCLREFARLHNIPYLRIYKRVRRGMTPEQAAH